MENQWQDEARAIAKSDERFFAMITAEGLRLTLYIYGRNLSQIIPWGVIDSVRGTTGDYVRTVYNRLVKEFNE